MDQPTTLSLSQEELTYLLHLLKIPALVGLSPRSTNGMNPYHFHALMSAAERSLRARQWLTLGPGGDRVIDTELFDILRFCARPDYTILVARYLLDAKPAHAVYYLSGRTRIKQYVENGVHHFVRLADDMTVFDDLFGIITAHEDVNDGARGNAGYCIPATLMLALSRIRSTDDLDHEALRNQLVGQGLPETGADHLAHLVRYEMIANTTISAQPRRSPHKTGELKPTPAPVFSLMQTQAAWWLASPVTMQPDTIPSNIAQPHTSPHDYILTALDTHSLYTQLNGLLMPCWT
ncbi:MAG: hypothetical protein JXA10_08055 [Anaerolineae bacterium]|nr:hypothetical protein [Anaerolineae bacterium]